VGAKEGKKQKLKKEETEKEKKTTFLSDWFEEVSERG